MAEANASHRVTILLDEYKELGAEVRLRLDLQHRNMSVLLVLVTAITGYLVNYASDHGLDEGADALSQSEILVLMVLAPIVMNLFLWRHLDHDINIIDKAAYIDRQLRPALAADAASDQVLGFEGFLHERRALRPRRAGPFALFGKEDIPMFFLLGTYLLGGWYVSLGVDPHAGDAEQIFDILLYVGTGLSVISLAMAMAIGQGYATVGRVQPPDSSAPATLRTAPSTPGAGAAGPKEGAASPGISAATAERYERRR